jgi:hypothetical protein
MTIKEKLALSFLGLCAYCYKLQTYIFLLTRKKIIFKENNQPRLIVALTSYGRRVRSCAKYAIMSMIKQKNITIDKVILVLDHDNWTLKKLPWTIKRYIKLGVDVMLTEDIKSYKKLLPVLCKYKNSNIVTIDDDYYYSDNLIKKLYDEYLLNPKKVICAWASVPHIDGNVPSPYLTWEKVGYKNQCQYNYIFPVGCAGILYPPAVFEDEIFNKSVFLKFAPSNDDVWFWIMAIYSGIKHKMIDNSDVVLYPTDLLYQVLHKDSALYKINHKGKEDKDDIHLKHLIKHYNLWFQ